VENRKSAPLRAGQDSDTVQKLRMWNSIFNRDKTPTSEQPLAPVAITRPFGERMLLALETLRWEARGAGHRLPVAALPQLGRIEDVLQPLLTHLVDSPPSVDEEIAVNALLTDYLPTTLRSYLGLSPQFATQVDSDGRTPGDELMKQLSLLADAAEELGQAIYAHDATRLQVQGRFLTTKFSKSDLSL
jgi:hypothetical protein